jgi:arabinogalactan oligomer / maltooligosaccharide transport system substrate-binding protein
VTDPGGSSRPPWPPTRRPGPQSDGKSNWRFALNLLIPSLITVLIGTIGFGLWQLHSQNESDEQLSQSQHQSDQMLEKEQERAATLQTYINVMQGLLVDHKLATSGTGDEVRQVARVQTLTTLRSLDNATDNQIVLQFLQDAHLIGGAQAIINLSNADLSYDDLVGANLSGTDLNGATLTGAELNGANLSNASLSGANLTGADLDGTQLRGGTLTDAVLKNANMTGATMTDAVLTGADLGGADMNRAELIGANLASANLTGADMSGANLNDALLLNSYSTQQQLNAVQSCTDAVVSPLVCYHVPKIKLTYWYTESPYEAKEIKTLIGQFEKANRNIIIKAVPQPFADWESGFATAGLEGAPPDVLRVSLGWVDQLASQGTLLNLDPYKSEIENGLSNYPGSPLGTTRGLTYDSYAAAGTAQENLYGVPQVTDFLALLYNKAELAKAHITIPSPPSTITMTEFEADANQVVHTEKGTYGFETDGTSYAALPFLYAFGGGMIDKNNHIVVNSPGSVDGLTFLLNLQNHDKVMPQHVNFSAESASSRMVSDFMTGKTAMIFDGPYDVSQILQSPIFRNNHGNLGIAAIPTGPAGQPDSPLGGQSYAISAATDYPAEAASFISFMSQPENQLAIAEKNDTLPPLSSAYAKTQLSSDQFISAFLSIAKTAVGPPTFPQAAQLYEAFDQNIANALDGIESPSLALTTVAEDWRPSVPGS